MAVDKSKYVVLDIETNGLRITNDILTISIFKPDDGMIFNKYLPLELNPFLSSEATKVNGITEKDLIGASPLTQKDVDKIIKDFELDKRIVLTYGNFDKRMLKHYFLRKGLVGFQRFNFYNFKDDIISSRWSEGNITKDNLCNIYGISNVTEIHSSVNDCILEWELFENMDSKKLFITNNKVFEMNNDYIIPISYFDSHPKLEKYVSDFPYVKIETQLLRRFKLRGEGINRFGTNINGMLIEHLINSMLKVNKHNSRPFLLANKSKLRFLGTLPSKVYEIPLYFKEDGTVKEVNVQDRAKAKEFNKSILKLKRQLGPIIKFIAHEIFEDEKINSQELVVNKEDNVLALCDLSTKNAILEIKTNYKADAYMFRNQLYYEANGRKAFLLQVDWSGLPDAFAIEILEANLSLGERQKKGGRELSLEIVEERIGNENIEVAYYAGRNTKLTLKCKTCEYEWQSTYYKAIKDSECPFCKPKEKIKAKEKIGEEERKKLRAANYAVKVLQKSSGCINAKNYTGAKDKVMAECLKCGYIWDIRADHLLDRPYCTRCKANKNI